MKKIILMMMLLPATLFANTVIIDVPGMVCQLCVQGMQKNFKSAVKNPLKDVIVNLDNKTVTVNLLQKVTDDEIKERVRNAGYNAQRITWKD